MRLFLCSALTCLSVCSLSAGTIISSGGWSQHDDYVTPPNGQFGASLVGSSGFAFSLASTGYNATLPLPTCLPSIALSSVCSLNLSQTAQAPNFFTSGSLTYGGTTYGLGAGYSLAISLTFSAVATSYTQACTFPDPLIPNIRYACSGGTGSSSTPFMATGSFTLLGPGGAVVATDTLTGSGTASYSHSFARNAGGDAELQFADFTFAPAAAPEPATIGLTAAGLFVASAFARRRR